MSELQENRKQRERKKREKTANTGGVLLKFRKTHRKTLCLLFDKAAGFTQGSPCKPHPVTLFIFGS